MVNRRPPQMSEPYRTGVSALVKWYNPTKGFGFVQPEDGSPDAFLHASLVAQAGHDDLPEGTALVCDIAEGPRGPQVAAIQSVEPPSEPVMRSRPPRRPRAASAVEAVAMAAAAVAVAVAMAAAMARWSKESSSSSTTRRASASSFPTTAARTCSSPREP